MVRCLHPPPLLQPTDNRSTGSSELKGSTTNHTSAFHELAGKYNLPVSFAISPVPGQLAQFVATLTLKDQVIVDPTGTVHTNKKAAKEAVCKLGIEHICRIFQVANPTAGLASPNGTLGSSASRPPGRNWVGLLQEFCSASQGRFVPVYREYTLGLSRFAAEVEIENLEKRPPPGSTPTATLGEDSIPGRGAAVGNQHTAAAAAAAAAVAIFGDKTASYRSKKLAKTSAAQQAVDYLFAVGLLQETTTGKVLQHCDKAQTLTLGPDRAGTSTSSSSLTAAAGAQRSDWTAVAKRFLASPSTITIRNADGLSWRDRCARALLELGLAPPRYVLGVEAAAGDGAGSALYTGYAALKGPGKSVVVAPGPPPVGGGGAGGMDGGGGAGEGRRCREVSLGVDDGVAYATVRHVYGRENAKEELARRLWARLVEVCRAVGIELKEDR